MRVSDILKLSTRMFRTRPMRTWLTILGISVGISTVVFLVSLGYGLQKILLEKIVFNEALLSLTVTPASELLELTPAKVDDFARLPQVKAVAPLAIASGQIAYEEVNGTVEVRGADPAYFGYAGIQTSAGDPYTDSDTDGALVSEAVLRLFGIDQLDSVIGDSLTLKMFAFTGGSATGTLKIVTTTLKITGVVKDTQNSFLFIPLTKFKSLSEVQRYEQVQIRVQNSADLPGMKEIVVAKGFQVQSLQETIDQANKIFQIFQIILGLFGAVALVVSAIGMFNTMTVTLLERTNEIGIMRALGAGKKSIRWLFLTEAIILGALGGLVGLGLGVAVAKFCNFIINSLAARFGGASANLFYFPPWFVILVFMLSGFIGFFSGVFPARRGSKMDPLEALRYK